MPPSPGNGQPDAIRRFHAADDKARNERQKALLLQYVARLRIDVLSRLHDKLHRTMQTIMGTPNSKA